MADRNRMLQRETELIRSIEEAREEKKKFEELNAQATAVKQISPAERQRIAESKEFQQFFGRASVVMERCINMNEESYDYLIDYFSDKEQKSDSKKLEILVRKYLFKEPKCANRPITSLNYSPKFPELLLASYSKQEDSMSMDPDGTVLVWNSHMEQRPERSFYCQSAVLNAQFHPTNPKLIIGSTSSGQVVIWDMREKSTPVNRTSLSRGHTHPIYALRFVPLVNKLHNIVSVSTDAHLCVWSDNSLHEPSLDLNLKFAETPGVETKTGRIGEVTTTSVSLPGRDTNVAVFGSDEGYVYKGRLYDKPGFYESLAAHEAPITAVEFHPVQPKAPQFLSDLFLTSSYDWTVKLWNYKSPQEQPLLTFEGFKDYVYDVQWSPVHPGIFAAADGTGRVDLWNLTKDSEVPQFKVQLEPTAESREPSAAGKLRFSDDGLTLAVGSSHGAVHVYHVDEKEALPPTDLDKGSFFEKLSKIAVKEA